MERLSKTTHLDLTGQVFGRLTPLHKEYTPGNPPRMKWRCRCECGKGVLVRSCDLVYGYRVSCGCGWRVKNTKHLRCDLPEYTVWKLMRNRCNNPKKPIYKHYGARGIICCPEWNEFETFYQDMGPRPSPQHKLERKDNDGNYCKENCIWATQQVQMNNTRRNVKFTYQGETKCLAEWSRITGFSYATVRDRYHKKWSPERIIETPVHRKS